MALPDVKSGDRWRSPANVGAAVDHLLAYAREVDGIDPRSLSGDPFGALNNHPGLTVVIDDATDGCSVYGHYTPEPPTIHIARSMSENRDRFTLLHEYAHHLQQYDDKWADVAWRISDERLRRIVEEDIANCLAATILIPADDLDHHTGDGAPTARQVADLHQATQASRQATVARVARAPRSDNTDYFISIVTTDGIVFFNQMVGDHVFAPPRGSHQPGIEDLINRAIETGDTVRAVPSDGIVYSTGKTRHDLRLDVHLAHDGDYAFVVGTKQHRYATAQWDSRTQLCNSPICETEFTPTSETPVCASCRQPRCPECGTCECEQKPTATCPRCWTSLTAADVAAERAVHEECE